MGTVATRRRARLRQHSRAKGVVSALRVFDAVITAGGSLLTSSADAQTSASLPKSYAQRRELLPLPVPTLEARTLFGDA